MDGQFSRFVMLTGEDALARLRGARVAVFGIGGVGGYAVEALARSGVGTLDLIDNDTVAVSNLNRQIIATHATVGKEKVAVAKARVLDISPDTAVHTYSLFYGPETADLFDLTQYDYIVDAIDSVGSKLLLIERAKEAGTPIVSSMGTGNKFDPTRLTVSDISKTSVCPLARVMRTELRKRGIHHLKVVWSDEAAVKPQSEETNGTKRVPGSTAFVPATAGLILASEVVRDLIGK